MSEPIRRRIVEILASGEHSAGNISEVICTEFSVTRSAVSKHLRILLENDWIDVRIEYTSHIYFLDDDALGPLEDDIYWLKELWRRRIGANERNDPQPDHAKPIGYERPPRLRTGRAKGLRGTGMRRGLWAPKPD